MERRYRRLRTLIALVVSLPFFRGLLSGQSFFYRDLAQQFFPLRGFIVEGLRRGELRYWNPYVHEGERLTLLPLGYPVDLLQVLLPTEWGFSLLLALHVPLAAVAFMALAREMGFAPVAAAGGALLYSLGGFCLSSLNLYVHLQAVAWAPLLVLGLLRAASGGPRRCAAAAVVCAVVLSTTGVEVAAQAFVFGCILSFSLREPRKSARVAASIVLGAGIAALPLVVMRALVAESARAGGLSTDMVLAFSIHPMTFVQTVVAGLYGDLSDSVNRFWGGLFFSGTPYFMSLYLGAAALATAAVGVREGGSRVGRLVMLALAAAVVGLGRHVGLAAVVDAFPFLRLFRFPTKAFFTIHLAVGLLVSAGLHALAQRVRPWRWLAGLSLAAGAPLAAAPLLPWLVPAAIRSFLSAFFPDTVPWARRYEQGELILRDAAAGGLAAVAVGLTSVLVLARRIQPDRGAAIAVAILAADMLRTGSGLNPMVTSSFFELSRETSEVAAALKAAGGRVFSCDPVLSRSYLEARAARVGRHEVWTPAVYMETLTPDFNMRWQVPSAYSRDVTMLVPPERVLSPRLGVCASFDVIAERLRGAGVAHVLSLDPLEHPALALRRVVAPPRVAPLAVYVYALRDPLPLRLVATSVRTAADARAAEARSLEPGFREAGGTVVEGLDEERTFARGRIVSLVEGTDAIHMRVEADRPTAVVVRDAYAPGWRASVNGIAAPVLRADGRHRAIPIPAGASTVELRYRPPDVRVGSLLTLLSAGVALILWTWPSARPRRGQASPDEERSEPQEGTPALEPAVESEER
jgi:hypothetical protein